MAGRRPAGPTSNKRRVLEEILGAHEPLTIAEMAETLGLHHNAIRHHLESLLDAGLVAETIERRSSRGRPRYLYSPTPDARERAVSSYERVSAMLLEVIAEGATPAEVGERVGSKLVESATQLSLGDRERAIGALQSEMKDWGFAPKTEWNGTTCKFTLTKCPVRHMTAMDREVLCSLHVGVVSGAAKSAGMEVNKIDICDDPFTGCTATLSISIV